MMDTSLNRQQERSGAGQDDSPPAPHASGKKDRARSDADGQQPARKRRILRDAIIVVVMAVLVTGGWLWFQEAPLRRAQKALETGNAAKALSWSEFYLAYHPEDTRALSIKAQALVGVGRASEAIKLFDRVGVSSIDDTYIFARAFMMQEQWSRALPLLMRVLDMNPNHADALYEATSCRIRLKFLTEALETAERYTRLPGNESRGNILLGIIQGDQANYEAAIRAYERAIELSPNGEGWHLTPEQVFSQYAHVLLKAGRPEDAVQILKDRKPEPAICAALGDAYMQSGDLDNAVLAWEKALELEPANIFAREGLANVALQRNEPEKAIAILEPVKHAFNLKASSAYLLQTAYSRINPEEAEKWKEIAKKLRQQGQRESQYERAMLTAPHSPAAMVIRAHRFASRGNYEQAQDIADDLARNLPNDPLVQDLAEAIRNRTELPSLERLPINVPVSDGTDSTTDVDTKANESSEGSVDDDSSD